MAYDATEVLDALREPTVTVYRRGVFGRFLARWGLLSPTKTYRGRILSHQEWLPFNDRLAEHYVRAHALRQRLKDATDEDVILDPEIRALRHALDVEMTEIGLDYVRAIGIPVRVIASLPEIAQKEAVSDFFSCQRAAEYRNRKHPTSGSSLPRLVDEQQQPPAPERTATTSSPTRSRSNTPDSRLRGSAPPTGFEPIGGGAAATAAVDDAARA